MQSSLRKPKARSGPEVRFHSIYAKAVRRSDRLLGGKVTLELSDHDGPVSALSTPNPWPNEECGLENLA